MKRRLLLFLALAGCGDDASGTPDGGPPAPWPVNGTLVDAPAAGRLPAGKIDATTAVLPGGHEITPTGTQVEVGGFPLGIRLLPGAQHLLVSDGAIGDEYLGVLDLTTRTVVQRIPFLEGSQEALFFGLAVRTDGDVFVSGGGSDVVLHYTYVASRNPPLVHVSGGDVALPAGSYPAGLAFIDDRKLLVANQLSGEVWEVDTQNGNQQLAKWSLTNYPYDVVVDAANQRAYVSQWAGNSITILDLASTTGGTKGLVITKKNPEALLLSGTKLLVTATDADAVQRIDLAAVTPMVTAEIDVAPASHPQRGSAPTHLALSPDGSRLYVADAGENCIDVFATANDAHLGRIPTAWYPTAIAVAADGTLYIANAKGMGATAYAGGGGDNTRMKGTIQIVPPPQTADLVTGDTQVEANNTRPLATGPRITCPPAGECHWPVPPQTGLPTPIEHVVLIVRENKTYDSCLGDLGMTGANGDPALTMWGEHVTPNLHKLARQYTHSDNFYSNAEASIQGHQWVTAGASNDYTEKAWLTIWGRATRPVTTGGAAPVAAPDRGYYWQHLGRAGIEYVSYGEIVGVNGAGNSGGPAPPLNIDRGWPGGLYFNLDSKDVDKAKYFADRVLLDDYLPRFTYVLLPNNHTNGLTAGSWTPEYMISDNDEATGRIVDAITKSHFWYTTAIFIVEDDPSDGYDHVEAHRSTLVVVSPWVRRGYISHVNYDVPSMWRTIELLLGLPAESQATATASPMFDIFAPAPDWSGYSFVPGMVPEAHNARRTGRLAELSAQMDFSTVDNAPGLGRILWEHVKGTPPPFPPRPEERWVERRERIPVLGGSKPPPLSSRLPPGASVVKDDDDDDD